MSGEREEKSAGDDMDFDMPHPEFDMPHPSTHEKPRGKYVMPDDRHDKPGGEYVMPQGRHDAPYGEYVMPQGRDDDEVDPD